MNTYEDFIAELEKAEDVDQQAQIMLNVTDQLREDADVDRLYRLWKARYYFTDKKKTRVGDRFVWIYLSLSAQNGSKAGQDELLEVYKKAFLSDLTLELFREDPQSVEEQMMQAAALYVSTMEKPPAIFGLIPQKDNDDGQRNRRIAKQLTEKHLVWLWQFLREQQLADEVAQSLVRSSMRTYGGIEKALWNSLDQPQFKEEFQLWAENCIQQAVAREQKDNQ